MASITKRNGVWRVQIRRRGYKTVSATFDKKRDAEIWAAEVEANMQRGKWQDADESTSTKLGEALERYLTEITPTKKGAKQETNRIKSLMKLPLADWYLTEIRSKQIADYRDARATAGKSPSTIRNELGIISQVFDMANKEWGMAGLKNPCNNVKRPKHKKPRDRRLKPTEETRLLEALPQPYRNAVALLLESAMRRGELCNLRWQDVNLHKRTAHIRDPKNGEDRVIPLSAKATQTIASQHQVSTGNYIFDIKPDSLTHAFIRATKEQGITDLHLHDLRREATSRLVESGIFSLPEIMRITGHKTLAAFNVYLHLDAEKMAQKMRSSHI